MYYFYTFLRWINGLSIFGFFVTTWSALDIWTSEDAAKFATEYEFSAAMALLCAALTLISFCLHRFIRFWYSYVPFSDEVMLCYDEDGNVIEFDELYDFDACEESEY